MKVRVYSSFPEVRLELNGKVIGTRVIGPSDRYIAEFEVEYSPGVLKATGTDGEKTETLTLTTAKEASKIILIPEKSHLTAGKNSLAFIQVEARDEEDVLAVNADMEVEVRITGEAELLSAGNAFPLHEGSFTDGVFKLFRGKGMIIIRSTGTPGEVSIELSSENMEKATPCWNRLFFSIFRQEKQVLN